MIEPVFVNRQPDATASNVGPAPGSPQLLRHSSFLVKPTDSMGITIDLFGMPVTGATAAAGALQSPAR